MIWTTRQRSEGPEGLHFFEAGDGPVLVLIHGVGLQAEAWSAMLPSLAGQFRVICVDMPGHGASPLQAAATLADYTARLAGFIGQFTAPVLLAGHSMGALIAVQVAAQHPGLVHAVAALNGVYRRTPEAAAAVQARATARSQTGTTDPTQTLQRWFGVHPQGPDQEAAEACRLWLTGCDPDGYAAAYLASLPSKTGPLMTRSPV